MKALSWAGLAAAFAVLVGCPVPPKPPEPPVVVVDAGENTETKDSGDPEAGEIGGSRACSRACAKLRAFACPEGNESPDAGKGCTAICEAAEASGKFSLKPECVAAARTGAEIRACGTVRCAR